MAGRNLGRQALLAIVVLALAGPIAVPALPAAGADTCPLANTRPGDPHPGPAVPFIGGTITDDHGAPIPGAVVLLSRCVQSFGVPVAIPAGVQFAAADGGFSFTDLSASASYVVSVPLDGVLSGRTAAPDTRNPSWVIPGSQGDDHVDMAFE